MSTSENEDLNEELRLAVDKALTTITTAIADERRRPEWERNTELLDNLQQLCSRVRNASLKHVGLFDQLRAEMQAVENPASREAAQALIVKIDKAAELLDRFINGTRV